MLRYVFVGALLLASCADGGAAPAMEVSVCIEGIEALGVTTSTLTAAPRGVGREWLSHELRFENLGDRTLYLQDHRTGAFLGDREILAGDDGCGWGQGSPDDPVEIACNDDYRPMSIEPTGTAGSPITLWRDLTGMKPVRGTRFEFRKALEVRFSGPFDDPRETAEQQGAIVVVYTFR